MQAGKPRPEVAYRYYRHAKSLPSLNFMGLAPILTFEVYRIDETRRNQLPLSADLCPRICLP